MFCKEKNFKRPIPLCFQILQNYGVLENDFMKIFFRKFIPVNTSKEDYCSIRKKLENKKSIQKRKKKAQKENLEKKVFKIKK